MQGLFLFANSFCYSFCQLVWAGCRLFATRNAAQQSDYIISCSAFSQCSHALVVAVTAADDFYIFYNVVFNVKFNAF